jgi:hypothetical protein
MRVRFYMRIWGVERKMNGQGNESEMCCENKAGVRDR